MATAGAMPVKSDIHRSAVRPHPAEAAPLFVPGRAAWTFMRAKDGVGRYGERVAERHLCDAGLTILARNWRCPDGELDLVARDGNVLVFCEVKTRSSLAFGHPAEAVGGRKAARIRALALHWLAEQRRSGVLAGLPELRFDVVSVLRSPRGAATVQHLRGAF